MAMDSGARRNPSQQRPDRVANQLKYLQKKVLNAVWKHRDAWPFHEPVDVETLNIPEYRDIIKNPMDLGTIKTKLETNAYCSVAECIQDFDLVFSNAYLFNTPGSEIVIMCQRLQEFFLEQMQQMPQDVMIFEGCKIAVDFSPRWKFKEKQAFTEKITQNGGTVAYAVSKQSSFLLLTDPEGQAGSYRSQTAQRYGVPVLVADFVNSCLDSGKLVDYESFLAAGSTKKDAFSTGRIMTTRPRVTHTAPKSQKDVDIDKLQVWPWRDASAPEFDEQGYQLAKGVTLFLEVKDNFVRQDTFVSIAKKYPTKVPVIPTKTAQLPEVRQTRFIVIEIHVSSEKESQYPYRVFMHYGTIPQHKGDDGDFGTKDCRYLETAEEALSVYAQMYERHTSPMHGYSRSGRMLHQSIGSTKYREYMRETEWSTVTPHPEVTRVVELFWAEAVGQLDEQLSESPENITLDQVDSAEAVLVDIRDVIRGEYNNDFQVEAIEDAPFFRDQKLQMLSEEFYKYLPQQYPSLIHIVKQVAQKQELCQLLRDMRDIRESIIPNSMTLGAAKLFYLHCSIDHIETEDPDYSAIKQLIERSNTEEEGVQVQKVYRVRRSAESEQFSHNLSNRQLLLHASRPQNFLGILSRGLLMPKIVVDDYGGSRSDPGMLGDGLYFSDSALTCAKYSCPSSESGRRFLLVHEVALGNCLSTYTHNTKCRGPPADYHSLHGVRATQGTASDFMDDEYVIYHTSQQRMRYLVEFSCTSDKCVKKQEQANLLQNLIGTSNIQPFGQLNSHFNKNVEQQQGPNSHHPGDMISSNLCYTPVEELKQKIDLSDVENVKDPLNNVQLGLVADNQAKIVLKEVHVRAKMVDLVARVVLLQSYTNTGQDSVEGKYVFAVDDLAVVSGFEAFINGKHVIGKVKDKEEARTEYKQAIKEGHGAYLMEQQGETPEVSTVSVGNLPPGASVLIKITYITELLVDGYNIVFSLPSSLATWKHNEVLNTQAQVGLEMAQVYKPREISLQVAIEMPFVIKSIKSPSHKIKIKQTETKALVALEKNESLDNQFTLQVALDSVHSPRMWVERHPESDDSRACMLAFYPEFDTVDQNSSELVLLLDMSNSMSPEDVQAARKVLLLCLKHCPQSWMFNVVVFGTGFVELFPRCQQNTKQNRKLASNFVQDQHNHCGNTEVFGALKPHYLLPPSDGVTRNIFLLSDGDIKNEEIVLQAVFNYQGHTRLFTMGIGNTCNKHCMRKLAQNGAGAFELFDPARKSRWIQLIKEQLKRANQPVLTSVEVDWQQFEDDRRPVQAPQHISSLFNGSRLVVYGFVPNCTQATLKARIGGKEVSTLVSTSELCVSTGTMLHQLTARSVIRDWEDGMLNKDKTLNAVLKRKRKNSIINTSKKFSIVSQFTSFVAVEMRAGDEINGVGPGLADLVAQEDVDTLMYMGWEDAVSEQQPPTPQKICLDEAKIREAREEVDSLVSELDSISEETYKERALRVMELREIIEAGRIIQEEEQGQDGLCRQGFETNKCQELRMQEESLIPIDPDEMKSHLAKDSAATVIGIESQAAPQSVGSVFGTTHPVSVETKQDFPPESGTLFGSCSQNTALEGGLFGPANKITTSSKGGFFGSSDQATAPAMGGGLFESSNQTASSGVGLFGSSNQATISGEGGLFGSSNQATTSSAGLHLGMPDPATGSTGEGRGLFGSPNKIADSSGLFQSSDQNACAGGGGLFGSSNQSFTSAGGGLFGSSNQATSRGVGIFGSSGQATAFPGGGALLGSSASSGGGGLFGSSNQTTASKGGVLFGSAPQATAPLEEERFGSGTASSPGGGFFATSNQTTSSTGVRGRGSSSNQNTAVSGKGGLFGSTDQVNTSSGGGRLFGSFNQPTGSTSSAGGLFGSANQHSSPSGGGLFATSNQTPSSIGRVLFGSSASSGGEGGLFGSPNQTTASTEGALFGSPHQATAPLQEERFGSGTAPSPGGEFFATSNQTTSSTGGVGGGDSSSNQNIAVSGKGGLFGSTDQVNTSSGGRGLFGSSNQSSTFSAGGLFGSANQHSSPSGGGLFVTSNRTPSSIGRVGFGSSASSGGGGGLFGSSNQNTASTGGVLFGSPHQAAAPLQEECFGSGTTPSPGGGFYATSNQTPSSIGRVLFGSSASSGGGGGLFGSSNQNTASTGGVLFGSPHQATAPLQEECFGSGTAPSPGGGFYTTSNQTPSSIGRVLFGSSASSGGGGGLFGSSNQNTASTGGVLFGSPHQATAPLQEECFGSGTAPSPGGGFYTTSNQTPSSIGRVLFGSSASSGGGGGLFGSSNQNTASTGGVLFGSPHQATAPLQEERYGSGTAPSPNQRSTSSEGLLFGPANQPSVPSGEGLFASFSQATSSTGGLFGSVNQATVSSVGEGLFGSAKQATVPSPGGLFGSSNNAAAFTGEGRLFGSPNRTTISPGGGQGVFGSSHHNTATAGERGPLGSSNQPSAVSGGGLFGSDNQGSACTGGLFGSSNQAIVSSAGGVLFGSPSQATGCVQGGGSFGSFRAFGSNLTQSGFASQSAQPDTEFGSKETQSGFSSEPTQLGAVFGSQPRQSGFGFGSKPAQPGSGFGSQPTQSGSGFGSQTTQQGAEFGSQPTQSGSGVGSQPAQPGSAFGSHATQFGSGFGSQPAQPSSAFGSQHTQSGSCFGSQPTQPVAAFGSQPSQSGFGFGSRPAQPGSAFGSQPTQSAFRFGSQTAQPGSAFGSQATQFGSGFGSQPAQPGSAFGFQFTQSGFGFGSQPTQPVAAFGSRPSQSGFGFGSRPAQPGSAFGSQSTQSAFRFGSQTAQPGSAFGPQPTQSGFGFGSQPAQPGTAFGSQQAQSGIGFGCQPIQPEAAFGSQPTQSGFGFGSQPAQQGSAFGSQQTQSGFGFGSHPTEPDYAFGSQPAFGFGSQSAQPIGAFDSQPAQTALRFGSQPVQPGPQSSHGSYGFGYQPNRSASVNGPQLTRPVSLFASQPTQPASGQSSSFPMGRSLVSNPIDQAHYFSNLFEKLTICQDMNASNKVRMMSDQCNWLSFEEQRTLYYYFSPRKDLQLHAMKIPKIDHRSIGIQTSGSSPGDLSTSEYCNSAELLSKRKLEDEAEHLDQVKNSFPVKSKSLDVRGVPIPLGYPPQTAAQPVTGLFPSSHQTQVTPAQVLFGYTQAQVSDRVGCDDNTRTSSLSPVAKDASCTIRGLPGDTKQGPFTFVGSVDAPTYQATNQVTKDDVPAMYNREEQEIPILNKPLLGRAKANQQGAIGTGGFETLGVELDTLSQLQPGIWWTLGPELTELFGPVVEECHRELVEAGLNSLGDNTAHDLEHLVGTLLVLALLIKHSPVCKSPYNRVQGRPLEEVIHHVFSDGTSSESTTKPYWLDWKTEQIQKLFPDTDDGPPWYHLADQMGGMLLGHVTSQRLVDVLGLQYTSHTMRLARAAGYCRAAMNKYKSICNMLELGKNWLDFVLKFC